MKVKAAPLCIQLFPLESGLFALVDARDFWSLAEYEWYCLSGYAVTQSDGRKSIIYMHRAIANPPTGQIVDHINRSKLDNQRSNLRLCTYSENRHNCRKSRSYNAGATTSRYKGVAMDQHKSLWKASAGRPDRGGTVSLGYFASEIEAARAYDDYARSVFGEFARLNFPLDGERCALEPMQC